MKEKMLELPVDKIRISKWDVRKYPENPEEFGALMESIKSDGLLNPLTVMNLNNGTYLLVAGRRRLKACTELGLKEVPVYVKSESSEEWENDLVTVVENLHRRELKDYERSYGILHAYTVAGYTREQAIQGTKYLHNHGDVYKPLSLAEGSTNDHTTEKSRRTFKPDARFFKVCKAIAFKPNYQYQLLQLTRDLSEKTLEKADKAGLDTNKKIMLTHSKLREHPEIQNQLVTELASKQSESAAREKVYQTISDLETGYMRPSKTGKTYDTGHTQEREKVKGKIAKQPNDYYIDIKKDCLKFLYHATGRALTRGEYQYSKEIVNNTRPHRLNIAKSLDSDYRTLRSLRENYLDLVKLAIDDMIRIVNEEMETAEKKKGMISK